MQRSEEQLHDYLQDRLGESLRSVVRYDAEGETVVYLRDDVSRKITPAQAKELIQFLREREDVAAARERLGLDAGLKCIVRCWEDRIGLHFHHGPESGTLVTIEPTVARDLHSFVSECEDVLSDE